MIKFLIFILLTVGVILSLIYVGQIIFNIGNKPNTNFNSLGELKSEVNDTTTKLKETKEKVETVSKEIDEMKENLKNS
jgi:peptidoglycan hydrolase CwlO-like protein